MDFLLLQIAHKLITNIVIITTNQAKYKSNSINLSTYHP